MMQRRSREFTWKAPQSQDIGHQVPIECVVPTTLMKVLNHMRIGESSGATLSLAHCVFWQADPSGYDYAGPFCRTWWRDSTTPTCLRSMQTGVCVAHGVECPCEPSTWEARSTSCLHHRWGLQVLPFQLPHHASVIGTLTLQWPLCKKSCCLAYTWHGATGAELTRGGSRPWTAITCGETESKNLLHCWRGGGRPNDSWDSPGGCGECSTTSTITRCGHWERLEHPGCLPQLLGLRDGGGYRIAFGFWPMVYWLAIPRLWRWSYLAKSCLQDIEHVTA